MDGNRETQIEALDVLDSVDVLPDGAFPGEVIAIGPDKEAKVTSGGRKR